MAGTRFSPCSRSRRSTVRTADKCTPFSLFLLLIRTSNSPGVAMSTPAPASGTHARGAPDSRSPHNTHGRRAQALPHAVLGRVEGPHGLTYWGSAASWVDILGQCSVAALPHHVDPPAESTLLTRQPSAVTHSLRSQT
eukprot:358113-Chlamydomonas_euryale.AAC.7